MFPVSWVPQFTRLNYSSSRLTKGSFKSSRNLQRNPLTNSLATSRLNDSSMVKIKAMDNDNYRLTSLK